MSADNESIQQLMEITGLDELRAVNVLEINNYNLEQAINYHLENSDFIDFANTNDTNINTNYSNLTMSNQQSRSNNNNRERNNTTNVDNSDKSFVSENASLPDIDNSKSGMSSSATSSSSNILHNSNLIDNDDNVRAPIPSKREQLLLPEEDQFRLHYATGGINSRKRRPPSSNMFTFCPFRYFAREGQIQEELFDEFNNLANESSGFNSNTSSNRFDYVSASSSNSKECSESAILLPDNKQRISRFKKKSYSKNEGCDQEIDESHVKGGKRKRLEDLFRPPIDLLFWGTFQAARDHASSLNRWLIVNLQDQREFKSQVINRDVWSDKNIKEIISLNFILWQVSMENPEGMRFKTFYHVSECPYVCILDPRTGEERLTCDTTQPKMFYDDLMKFLIENDFCLDVSLKVIKATTSRTASSTATSNSIATGTELTSVNSKNNANNINIKCDKNYLKSKTHNTLDLSEEDQLELAIINSLKESQCSLSKSVPIDLTGKDEIDKIGIYKPVSLNINGDRHDIIADYTQNISNSNNLNQRQKSDTIKTCNKISKNSTITSCKDLIVTSADLITKIQIRLPNGEREELEWPSSSVVKCLKLYVCEKYPDITKDTYKLIQSYPRKNILELEDNITLNDAKLHPTSILYLHPDE